MAAATTGRSSPDKTLIDQVFASNLISIAGEFWRLMQPVVNNFSVYASLEKKWKASPMLRRFLADTRGNIAATFALMVVPIMGFAGVSVDHGRSVSTRTSLQNAIDATALMLAGDVKKAPTMTA